MFVALFQLADIVYGVVPQVGALTTMGTRNTGCGWGDDGVGGCLVGDEDAFAHEVGHLYGGGHIGDPTLASYDASYPNYGGSKTSIGEVGIDTALGATPLSDPASAHDLMSYRRPRWISPYTYLKILENREKHFSAPPILAKCGRCSSSPSPLNGWPMGPARSTRSSRMSSRARLRTAIEWAGGRQLVRRARRWPWSDHREPRMPDTRCRSAADAAAATARRLERAPRLEFVEAMQWSDEVKRIQIKRGDSVVASLDVGEAPSVEVSGPERREGSLVLHIRVRHPRAEAWLAVLFTGDDGQTWSPVAVDPEQSEPLTVDASSLPGGEACRFRAVATAEFPRLRQTANHSRCHARTAGS